MLFGHPTQVSNMLVPPEASPRPLKISEGVLLSLYEAVHLNRNFITVLTHVSTRTHFRSCGTMYNHHIDEVWLTANHAHTPHTSCTQITAW